MRLQHKKPGGVYYKKKEQAMNKDYIQKRIEKKGYKVTIDMTSGNIHVSKNQTKLSFVNMHDAYNYFFKQV